MCEALKGVFMGTESGELIRMNGKMEYKNELSSHYDKGVMN